MWWFFKKLNETVNSIIYAYGYESKNTTGQFEYDKISNKAKVLKYADNHSENIDIQYTAFQLVNDFGHLDQKMIAYG
jgi:hypothetical protein